MLRQKSSSRRFRELVTLYRSEVTVDEFGHKMQGEPVIAGYAYANIERLSATMTMMAYERADAVGVKVVVIPSRIDITYISICATSLYIDSYTEQQEEKFGYRGVFSSSNRRFLCFQIHIRWSSRFRDCIAFPWFSSFPLP